MGAALKPQDRRVSVGWNGGVHREQSKITSTGICQAVSELSVFEVAPALLVEARLPFSPSDVWKRLTFTDSEIVSISPALRCQEVGGVSVNLIVGEPLAPSRAVDAELIGCVLRLNGAVVDCGPSAEIHCNATETLITMREVLLREELTPYNVIGPFTGAANAVPGDYVEASFSWFGAVSAFFAGP
ncbi:hypothetical protein [Rhodococcus artemisiae]|uniref:Uncharacterized protein n=1 Tax=Rhodococcus artemisiae TaxID=714159 RepID=A0ABU7LIZ8_9NOCA|nr:hypothetical protein [Rhodococcus artemisiae]MEE2061530.1 hypothetical protein [Rhodococcus artemisiae]